MMACLNEDGSLASELDSTLRLDTRNRGEESDTSLTLKPEQDDPAKPRSLEDLPTKTCANKRHRGYTILCDMGYGVPREARPRKEKIRAIARQLVNFLSWQQQQERECSIQRADAKVCIVGCEDASIEQLLKNRMSELWMDEEKRVHLPENVTFTNKSLESFLFEHHGEGSVENESSQQDIRSPSQQQRKEELIYLSPDAKVVLSADQPPPAIVVVGLLIDRKHIQVDRSLQRATALSIPAARWPLEEIVLVKDKEENGDIASATTCTLDPSEPLNVDCIMEGMQQWYWNYTEYQLQHHYPVLQESIRDDDGGGAYGESCSAAEAFSEVTASTKEACFVDAVFQALQHHVERHPGRPLHKPK